MRMIKFPNKKLLSLFLLLLILASLPAAPAYAAGWPAPDCTVQSEGAILIDADSGVMLYGKNQDTAYYPASITKLLTAVIVLEKCKDLDDKVTFSYQAVNENLEDNSTVIGAVAGDKLSVRDCLYCLLLHSANDCANALAEYIAGSNDAFAELMNQKAAEIGCTNSHFANPSGLNNPQHYTTCSDMAKILRYAIQNETFRQIDAVQAYTHAPISKYPDPAASENTVYAHHRMMRKSYPEYYEGVFAGKTGYTILAGNTLATACKRDGMTLICVILNGHNSQYSDSKNLFDYGYSGFSSLQINANDTKYSSLGSNMKIDGIPVVDTLSMTISDSSHATLPKNVPLSDASSRLTYDLSDAEKADGSIARVDYTYENRAIGSAYIRLLDQSGEKAAASQDAAVMEAKVQETVPETIPVSGNESVPEQTVAGQLPQSTEENHAPIIFDKTAGRIIIQKPVMRVLLILLAIAAVTGLVFLIYYLIERRGEFIRKRRRARMLKHTKDLTREQKARRDLLLSKRTKKKDPDRRKNGL